MLSIVVRFVNAKRQGADGHPAAPLDRWRSPAEDGWLLFANPHHPSECRNLSVKLSRDEGATWPVNKTLEEGLSAYADLAQLPDGTVLCFYERRSADQKELYGRVTLARFSIDWLTMPGNR